MNSTYCCTGTIGSSLRRPCRGNHTQTSQTFPQSLCHGSPIPSLYRTSSRMRYRYEIVEQRIQSRMQDTEDVIDTTDEMVGVEDDTIDFFDFSSAVPKKEIQASKFLKENPEFDGRGCIVAIFDTGVDPGASGLYETPTGERKIVDVVDATGSGDVDMSTVRTGLDEDGCVQGVYGNKLKVHPDWKNPSQQWHVGSKRVFELWPAGLVTRMKKERKKQVETLHRGLVTEASRALDEFGRKNPLLKESDRELIKEKEELEMRVTQLETLYKKYEDCGPSVDCVTWFDGEKWLAAMQTTEIYEFYGEEKQDNGLLEKFEPLTNYRDCLKYGTFSPMDACNFVMNVYNDGKTLSIVVDAGSHGTHVAGITSAYHPEDPDGNGMAPGAKIVSVKIGDTRLGSMETMTGLTRALTAVVQNDCDLINMSYGEACHQPNMDTRWSQLVNELVYKHRVTFVASAGNAGPALSTVGAPGGSFSSIMGIGAFVSPTLAMAGHSTRHELESGAQYTWSSRGPAIDGDIGVSISAPGGSVSPVPQWTSQVG